MTITHNTETWFKEVGGKVIEYYNTKFSRSLTGQFSIPAWFAKKYQTAEQLEKFASSMANMIIDLIVKRYQILRRVPFAMLETKDRDTLRELICVEIQNKIFNKKIMQVLTGSVISGGSFSATIDDGSVVFSLDTLCQQSKIMLMNSELDLYDIVDEGGIRMETPNGNIKVLRQIDLTKEVPNIVWDI